jgi:NADH dehydrogenase
LHSKLGYYRGKAILEADLAQLGVPYSILRPTVIFGREDVLMNNIAWFLRKFPFFGIPGDGKYRVRPIYVEDMAKLLADELEMHGNRVIDAVGPETVTFEDLVRTIAAQLGRSPRIAQVPAPVAYAATRVVGWLVGDVVLTWQEFQGLTEGLLAPDGPATGKTRFSDWLAAHHEELGTKYSSELARHFAATVRDRND